MARCCLHQPCIHHHNLPTVSLDTNIHENLFKLLKIAICFLKVSFKSFYLAWRKIYLKPLCSHVDDLQTLERGLLAYSSCGLHVSASLAVLSLICLFHCLSAVCLLTPLVCGKTHKVINRHFFVKEFYHFCHTLLLSFH